MFEEEKEIHLHDLKKVRYALSYVKNVMRYKDKRVVIPILEVWGSSQCNLRCKECMNRIPFASPEKVPTDTIIHSIGRLSEMAKLNRIVISGGEPLLNDELHKIVLFLNLLPDVKKIYIITNGTLMPDEKLLYVLSNADKAIKIVMNEYQGVTNRIGEIKEELKQRKIAYVVRRLGDYQWKGIGNDICEPLHYETGRMIYAECWMRKYAVLQGDTITKCPRGVVGRKHNIWIEHLRLSRLKNNAFSRAKLAVGLDSDIHKEYCRMCFGLSDENPYTDVPGIQIKS